MRDIRKRWRGALTGGMLCFLATAVWGQEERTDRGFRWLGPVANPQSTLEEAGRHGVAFQYQYVQDLSAIPLGDAGEHGWFGRYTWTLAGTVDLQKAVGWNGTSGYASMKQHVLEFGQMWDGVAQGYSNLDANPRTMLYEAWIEQQMLGGKLTLKAGRMDSNADFDAAPTAADFLNSSMGYSPTVMEFPSYPSPQPAVEITAALNGSTRISAGEFRTPSGRITLVEGDRSWAAGTEEKVGHAAVGMWHLTESMTRLNGSATGGTSGFYGVLEQSLWSRPVASGKAESLSGYLQAGTGDGRVNPYCEHVGAGLVLSGPLRRRPGDAAGMAASWAHLGDRGSETVIETYYKLSFGRAIAVVPDVQYFRNPGGRGTQSDALVVTPRLVITF